MLDYAEQILKNTYKNILYNELNKKKNNSYTTTTFYIGNKPYTRKQAKIGRNEKCPCRSGKKYKNCCGKGE